VNQALGLIETIGKVAAVTAMDAAVKAANVTLISLENSRGQAKMCVKLVGEVSAVKAAVEAGCSACKAIGGEVYSSVVIARPSEQLDDLIEVTKGHCYIESWHLNKEVKPQAIPERRLSTKKVEEPKVEAKKEKPQTEAKKAPKAEVTEKVEKVEEKKEEPKTEVVTEVIKAEEPAKVETKAEVKPLEVKEEVKKETTEVENKTLVEEKSLQVKVNETVATPVEKVEKKEVTADSDREVTKDKKVNSQVKNTTKKSKSKK